jgi:hypothetical protein
MLQCTNTPTKENNMQVLIKAMFAGDIHEEATVTEKEVEATVEAYMARDVLMVSVREVEEV